MPDCRNFYPPHASRQYCPLAAWGGKPFCEKKGGWGIGATALAGVGFESAGEQGFEARGEFLAGDHPGLHLLESSFGEPVAKLVFGESQPLVGVEFAGFFERVLAEIEHEQFSSGA